MKKYDILNRLKKNYLVAVVRGKNFNHTVSIIDAIVEGGINNIEITYTTPGASDLISHYRDREDICVGAGTVMTASTADEAIRQGASYVVSPHFDSEIARLCNIYHIPYLPGCGSVTEVTAALAAGVDVVKLFPGGVLGASFIKDIKGPIPHANVMPSGGVSKDNINEWIDKGAFAVGIGSALTKGFDGSNPEIVTQNTKEFVTAYQNIKEGGR
jgi:2-dehydro-3-deoxyphosphogluconate aldolase/(4S)-4-hydroxy-2-oxoglutarate aldolase